MRSNVQRKRMHLVEIMASVGHKEKTTENVVSGSKKQKRSWNNTKVTAPLDYLSLQKLYKTKCEFNGIDFQVDLQCMYTELRHNVAADFPKDFGVESLTESDMSIKYMDSDQYEAFKSRRNKEKADMKKGYKG